jgi:squalene-hopene/tetraprenyl-beta-curcumene cyclase
MPKKSILSFVCLTLMAPMLQAEPLPQNLDPKVRLDESTRNEAKGSILRGKQWLLDQQQEKGHWSTEVYPAMTGLALWALLQSGDITEEKDIAAVNKAKAFLLSQTKPDGSIYHPKGGLRNYNTALSMVALHMTGHEDAQVAVLKARTYVAKSQHLADDEFRGGFGYDQAADRLYADGINTATAVEAMTLTQDAEDRRPAGQPKASINKEAVSQFYDRTKNDPKVNKGNVHVSEKADDQGGHFYKPNDTRGGSYEAEDGTIKFNSYASMTYAAMLSYIYADVSRDDHRVKSTYDWARKHWTLEENPGNGMKAYYYFFNVLSKGLNALDQDIIETADGPINWRAEVLRRGIELQKIETNGSGYWINEESKWMERDKVLVTAYVLIGMQVALGAE